MFVYVLLLTLTYIRMFAYVLTWILTYLHIFPLLVDEKEWGEGREFEKRKVDEGGENWLLRSDFLFLSNFMVAKGLFWFEYEMFVFGGEFCWVMMMMIEIKIIITLPFLCGMVFMAGNKNYSFWPPFAIIMTIIKVTVMVIIFFDNTYECL